MPERLTKEYLENNGYVHRIRYHITDSKHFDVFEAPEDFQVKPWCITYFGHGCYFQSLRECLIYAYGRSFIKYFEIERIDKNPQKSYYRGYLRLSESTPGDTGE